MSQGYLALGSDASKNVSVIFLACHSCSAFRLPFQIQQYSKSTHIEFPWKTIATILEMVEIFLEFYDVSRLQASH